MHVRRRRRRLYYIVYAVAHRHLGVMNRRTEIVRHYFCVPRSLRRHRRRITRRSTFRIRVRRLYSEIE